MSNTTVFIFFFRLFLVGVGTYAILYEPKIVELEHKTVKYIKAFFKALYLTIQEKRCEK